MKWAIIHGRYINSLVFILLLALSLAGFANETEKGERKEPVEFPFRPGERFEFRVLYNSHITGNVKAGNAVLEVREQPARIDGRELMHFVGTVETIGVFNWFFRVENSYESYFDPETSKSLRFIEQVREGGYRRNYNVTFDYDNLKARSVRNASVTIRQTTEIPGQLQDLLSAFYYTRSFDLDSLEAGDAIGVDLFMHDTVYVSRVMYEGREQITTSMGTFNTLKFKPEVLEGPVFSQPYPMTIWISDDKNRIPIRIESGLVVGRARLEMSGFRRLRYPIESFVPDSGRRQEPGS
ncbi:MAG: DUF3108 domain-containing protein [Bacteroidales bacterium]